MKKLQLFTVLALIVCAGSVVYPQKKTTTKRSTTTKRTTTVAKPALTAPVILAKEQVANQLSNVKRFIDVLGPIAQGIEAIDSDAKTKKLSRTTLDTNEANKQKVIAAIRNLKTGLVNLETDFRTKPDLKRFLPQIQGISDLSARCEDSALAGKFVASKEPLRTISQKLADTLAVLP